MKQIIVLGPARFSLDGRRQETSPGNITVVAERGRVTVVHLGVMRRGQRLFISAADGHRLTLVPESPLPQRQYNGDIEIAADANGLRVQNTVSSFDYTCSVVGSEMNPGFAPEALKAQAVLTQTLIARYKNGQELNDTTETQAYTGAAAARPEVVDALHSVWRRLLYYQGKPAKIFFHSTCAGGTSCGAEYFDVAQRSAPYLQAVHCGSCSESPFIKEKISDIPEHVVHDKLGIRDALVTATDAAKRPLAVRVVDVSGKARTVSGYQFWMLVGQKLGWDKIPGTRYSVSRMSDGRFEFRSTGAGHGVGLCQWGANGLAKQGKSYGQILQFYFPGTTVR